MPRNKALIPAPPDTLTTSFEEIVSLIQQARQRAFQAVNTELIELYWCVGAYISHPLASAAWGEGVVEQLARYLAQQHPELKGFNRRNLFRMRQFYDTYQGDEKVSPLVTQLSWTHNMMILSGCKYPEEREFYLQLCVREKWSKRELERQLKGALFARTILNPPKVSAALQQLHAEVETIFKDSYLLDFLSLPQPHSEADLQRGLVANLRRFLTELGRDFCFIGEQYLVQVGNKDFRLDLLMYHRDLQCLVDFELKIDDFKPEYLGQLNFYLEALDRDVRKAHERPSIGVLLCAGKDDEVVEYALSRSLSPALIAEYQLQLPDKKLLQAKLREFYELAQAELKEAPQQTKARAPRRRE